MQLKIIGSSSAGNCYILENDKEVLIIECGLRFDIIKNALGFNLSKIVGCIITHEHKDHSLAALALMAAGINIYSSAGTIKALGLTGHRAMSITESVNFKLGGFKVMAFDVRHDAAQPFGYLINHEETGNVLFLTDTYYVPYTFRNLHNIIVETNYSEAIIERKIAEGGTARFLRNRIIQSHMSLETCKGLLQANDLSQVNNIVLIHLSDSHSDAGQFKQEIERCTGKTVHVADAGVVIENFNKEPF